MRYHYRNKLVNNVPNFVTETIKQLPATEQVLVSKQASYVGHFDSPKNALALLKRLNHNTRNHLPIQRQLRECMNK